MTTDVMKQYRDPTCDKCGAEITTGLMALYCPKGIECEFYPDDPESRAFLKSLQTSSDAGEPPVNETL